jgi:flagella basal body P-ring formation protein FlgA
MTEIPTDVMQAARKAAVDCLNASGLGDEDKYANAIARAIMAREAKARDAALEEAAKILDRRAKEENERCEKLRFTKQYKAREAAHVARIAQSDAAAIRAMKRQANE